MEQYYKIVVPFRDILITLHSRKSLTNRVPWSYEVMDLGTSGKESMQLIPQRMVILSALLPTVNVTTARVMHRTTIAIEGYPEWPSSAGF